MSDDSRKDSWFSWTYSGLYAHPDSPMGGSGPGCSRQPGPLGWDYHAKSSSFGGWNPHPEAPFARYSSGANSLRHNVYDDSKLFREKAAFIMRRLIDDFDLTPIQAAAILGNIGHECGMFHVLHERGQKVGSGGYGWAQWTGVRRKSFFEWVENHGGIVAWQDDEINYSYLKHELQNDQHNAIDALRKEDVLQRAVIVFERHFERAANGKQHYENRVRLANLALEEFIRCGIGVY